MTIVSAQDRGAITDEERTRVHATVLQLKDVDAQVRDKATSELIKLPLKYLPVLEEELRAADGAETKACLEKIVATRRVDQVVERWADARFWLAIDGHRSGWVHYQFSRTPLDGGEDGYAIDYERASYDEYGASERFHVVARANEFLSLRRLTHGTSAVVYSVPARNRMDYGPAEDPGDVAILPELIAAFIPPKEGTTRAFSTIVKLNEPLYRKNSISYDGEETIRLGKKEIACHKWRIAAKTAPYNTNREESVDAQVWATSEGSIAKTHSVINWQSWDGKPMKREEELIPATKQEWAKETPELNELRAAAELMLLYHGSSYLRANDADGNNKNDYWTGDVSGFYRIVPTGGKDQAMLIGADLAQADSSPLPAGDEKGGAKLGPMLCDKPKPLHGYLFSVMRRTVEGGKWKDLNDGTNRHNYLVAYCAYPAEHGKTGKKTFILDAGLRLFWKDTGGKVVRDCPEDASREGWSWGALKE